MVGGAICSSGWLYYEQRAVAGARCAGGLSDQAAVDAWFFVESRPIFLASQGVGIHRQDAPTRRMNPRHSKLIETNVIHSAEARALCFLGCGRALRYFEARAGASMKQEHLLTGRMAADPSGTQSPRLPA